VYEIHWGRKINEEEEMTSDENRRKGGKANSVGNLMGNFIKSIRLPTIED
jgi:hypothetical protein